MSGSAVICEPSHVLGKRTATEARFLNISAPQNTGFDHPSAIRQSRPIASGSMTRSLVIINGKLQSNTKRRYHCTQTGCDKAYTKPSRLAEHERSHTGERPFQCETCNKSYLRETHLHAHVRSHLPEASRPLVCPKAGCEKRFWTTQHLTVHVGWHEGAKPFVCLERGCPEAFSKHHQLRSHIVNVHSPPGTKSFQCEHSQCTQSFSTNQQLKAHSKTHDEKRYTCIHVDCINTSDEIPAYFPTWSALQNHVRNVHPPTCTRVACAGRTFTTQKGLRSHMKLHEQQDMMEALEGNLIDGEVDNKPVKRRRGGDWGRDWICNFENCVKDFKSKKALMVHKNVTHLGQRDFICSHESCHKTYGYKHLLQRHVAKAHGSDVEKRTEFSEDSLPASDEEDQIQDDLLDIRKFTGYAYSRSAQVNIAEGRALRCPFPHISSFISTGDSTQTSDTQSMTTPPEQKASCDYAFRRAYDLRRHLQASHGFSTEKINVERWVVEQKLAWYLPKNSRLIDE